MGVKPWEPVSGWFISDGKGTRLCWPWSLRGISCEYVASPVSDPLQVNLANGQRIIVRALSEDRKAARAAMKEASQ